LEVEVTQEQIKTLKKQLDGELLIKYCEYTESKNCIMKAITMLQNQCTHPNKKVDYGYSQGDFWICPDCDADGATY
jgi:hypothetical protein